MDVMDTNVTNLDVHRDEQPAELISGVLNDARELAFAEVDKLKAEAITHVKTIGSELKIASVGLLILTVAATMLSTAFAFGLAALGLPVWAGFGVVALAFGICGVVFLTQRRAIAKAV
jgi:hypothetical protein